MDAYNLVARLTLDTSEYDKALDKVRKDIPEVGNESEKVTEKVSKLGTTLTGAFKVVGAAVGAALGAAATGAVALVKQSTDAYANYQQLVGGVETLFSNLEGTISAAPKVLENAANAYKTAGLSANEYMETVTSFSAALVSSLEGDYDKAAEISDMAIKDMSDNANKMGTSMESIQNAYQGFAKQNYTMLDNLKLGFGGTKQEMERLLEEASKLSGIEYDISSLSDVYEAVHVIQQSMGITGTTAKEASDTITGSIGQIGGAWKNLVAGFADPNADLSKLIGDVVDTAEISFKNLMPTIENAIGGVAEFVVDIAPIVAERLPQVANELIPPVLTTAETVVNSLMDALPTLLQSVVNIAPDIVIKLSDGLIKQAPKVLALGKDLMISLAKGITSNLPELSKTALAAVSEISIELTKPETLTEIVNAGLDVVVALAEGIGDNLPQIAETVVEIAGNIYKYVTSPDFITKVVSAGGEIIGSLAVGVLGAIPTAIGAVVDVLGDMIDRATDPEYQDKWDTEGAALMDSFAKGIQDNAQKVIDTTDKVLEKIDKRFNTHLKQWYDEWNGFWGGLGNWAWETNYNLYGGKEAEKALDDAMKAHDILMDIRYAFNEKYRNGQTAENALYDALGENLITSDDWDLYEKYIQPQINMNEWARALEDAEFEYKKVMSLPSEALRQMRGEEAPTLALLQEMEESATETGKSFETLGQKVDETFNFEARDFGLYQNLGVIKQLGRDLTEEQEKADKQATEVFKRDEDYIKRLTNTMDLSITEQIELWEKAQAQYIEGSEQFLKAGDKISELQKKQTTELQKSIKTVVDAEKKAITERTKIQDEYKKKVEEINKSIEEIQKKYSDTLSDRTKEIYNSFSLFEKVPERILYSGVDLTTNLEEQIDRMEKFYTDVAKLSERGVSAALVQEIQGMGVGALDQLDALLDLSDDELKKYSDLYEKKNAFSASVAEGQLEGLKEETQNKITEKMAEIQTLSDETAEKIGLSWAESFKEGIKNGLQTIPGALQSSFAALGMALGANTTQSKNSYLASAENGVSGVRMGRPVTVNINGIQYQSLDDLVQHISEEMQIQLERSEVYAGA